MIATVRENATTVYDTTRVLVVALFIMSGAAGLMYQVVWSRELVLVFGNTSQAVSTIVTAVMAGLGLGGYVGGRLAARSPRPLYLYGICELLVAVFAVLLPFVFSGIGDVYHAAYSSLDPTVLALVRFTLALAAITPATFLMGLTLPLLTRFMVYSLHQAGAQVAELYAANTLGAVLGTITAAFVLIELLGLQGTSQVAVLLNLLAGGGALILTRRSGSAPVPPTAPAAVPETVAGAGPALPARRLILAATCISGFVALALEVLWTRMFAEGTGSTTYTFAIILSLYLAGIAIGSTIYRRRSSPARDTLGVLGGCFAGVGLAAVVTVVLGSGVLGLDAEAPRYLILLPATVLMGYAFPLAGRLLMHRADEAGASVGQLYAWNTAGSIVGAFAGVFILAPTLGTNSSILILAAISLLLGAGLVLRTPAGQAGAGPGLAGGLAGLAVLTLVATAARLPFTRTVTENTFQHRGVQAVHLEDSLATVDAVGGPPAYRRLYVGGVGMTLLTIDTRLMVYLPKALRPDADRLLVVAFGMGSAYRSGLILGLQTDAVELSPSVPSQMPVFFSDAAQYLDHPRGQIIIADGRNYVRMTAKQYDLIVVDPPPPVQAAGTVVLNTREFFAQGMARLRPGGVFMIWIPYGETLNDLKDHMRTFRSVFRHVTVVFSPRHFGFYMLGSADELHFDPATLARIFGSPTAQADLAGAPDALAQDGPAWARWVQQNTWLDDARLDAFVGTGPLITDNEPRTEYFLLRTLLAQDRDFIKENGLRRLEPGLTQ